mgnify:CR=1 FL=1
MYTYPLGKDLTDLIIIAMLIGWARAAPTSTENVVPPVSLLATAPRSGYPDWGLTVSISVSTS